jgi:glycosyltransferase involved in cell wall biosynthesis
LLEELPPSRKPKLTVGLPVFNGEKYLAGAIDSILKQTFSDFELVISDNASTDHTQHICREYAAKDARIRYYRNEKNIGASKNFNRVFELSCGEYFKWTAHDDLQAPTYLQKCVAVLDKDPSVIACHSETIGIDEHGRMRPAYRNLIRRDKVSSWKPHERFGEFLSIHTPVGVLLGVIRATSLRKTNLQENYVDSDRNLMAELALIGRIYIIPEKLFFGRAHPQSYTKKFYGDTFVATEDNYRQQLAWWSQDDYCVSPRLRNCSEFFRSVRRVKLNWSEKLLCYGQIFRWFVREGWLLIEKDLENLVMRRSPYGCKLISAVKSNLKRTIFPKIKKIKLLK